MYTLSMTAALILGDQLFEHHPALKDPTVEYFFLIEAKSMCQKLPYHKLKLVLVLSAMRHYGEYVKSFNKKVIYIDVNDSEKYFKTLKDLVNIYSIKNLKYIQPVNLSMSKFLDNFCNRQKIAYTHYESPYFLSSKDDLLNFLSKNSSSPMEKFYRWQRQRMNILINNDQPEGGAWNYDKDNRKPLPKDIRLPSINLVKPDILTKEVIRDVDQIFKSHPGKASDFWLPVTHQQAKLWLDEFISNRLSNFGPYEDAMAQDAVFLYHSVCSPLLNCGLLTPMQCVERAIYAYNNQLASLASVEGFIRQIIGWREYIYGYYINNPEYINLNYFGFTKDLEDWWYLDNHPEHQNLPLPVRQVLKRVFKYGYSHHIERLMVLGNWFLLNEYNPASVNRWFSSMFVDAYEWVMVPNVIGMSQYADGGKLATKPYISGANYINKMGRWDKWPKEEQVMMTDLYWRFLRQNYNKLKDNYRLKLVLKKVAP